MSTGGGSMYFERPKNKKYPDLWNCRARWQGTRITLVSLTGFAYAHPWVVIERNPTGLAIYQPHLFIKTAKDAVRLNFHREYALSNMTELKVCPVSISHDFIDFKMERIAHLANCGELSFYLFLSVAV